MYYWYVSVLLLNLVSQVDLRKKIQSFILESDGFE